MASRKQSNETSECELSRVASLAKKKQKKQLKAVQKSAKISNSAYLVDALMTSDKKQVQVESRSKTTIQDQKPCESPQSLTNESLPNPDVSVEGDEINFPESSIDKHNLSEEENDLAITPIEASITIKGKQQVNKFKSGKVPRKQKPQCNSNIENKKPSQSANHIDSSGNEFESESDESSLEDGDNKDKILKEVNALKGKLQRKINVIRKLKARNEKLERNSEICKDLNVKLQQKLISCNCKTENANVSYFAFVLNAL